MPGSTHLIARYVTRGAVLVAALWSLVLVIAAPAMAAPGDITTVAGTGTAGFAGDGGPAVAAQLFEPSGVAMDPAGRIVVADTINHRIRRIATDGTISTIAGTGVAGTAGDDGPATAAQLSTPTALVVDGAGNVLFADTDRRIRRIDAITGVITTVAGSASQGYSGDGGPATSAELNAPTDLHVDLAGNLYIAEPNNAQIRYVDATTGTITSLTGSLPNPMGGPPATIQLNALSVDVDPAGNIFYVDPTLEVVRRVDASTGTITEVAGSLTGGALPGDGGLAVDADLHQPWQVRLDPAGNLFIGQPGLSRIRFVDASTGVISTVVGTGTSGYAGDGGPATAAEIDMPWGLDITPSGDLLFADRNRHVVRLVDEAAPVPALAGGPWAMFAVLALGTSSVLVLRRLPTFRTPASANQTHLIDPRELP